MARVISMPQAASVLRADLSVGPADDSGGVLHVSPYTGGWTRIIYSRALLWSGRLVFLAEDHQGDVLLRAWLNEKTGNVLAIPISELDADAGTLPAFPTITAAARSGGDAVLALDAEPDPLWLGHLIHLAGRMARIESITGTNVTIYPAVVPETLPADIDAPGFFLFRVVKQDGGDTDAAGMRAITLEIVEAVGATAPEPIPDNALIWRGRALVWDRDVLIWLPAREGMLWRGNYLLWRGNTLAWSVI